MPIEALTCDYCGAPSPHAVRAKNARDQAALEREEAQLRADQEAMRKSSTYALIWSIAQVVVCCLPFPGIVGIWLARRAQTRARALGSIAPGTATAAIVIGGVGLAFFVAFAVFAAFELRAVSQRKAELHAATAEGAGAPTLSQHTACALVELRLLEDGFEEHAGSSNMSDSFECAGRLTQTSTQAVLHGFSFKISGEGRRELDACFDKGARWHVVDLVPSGERCD